MLPVAVVAFVVAITVVFAASGCGHAAASVAGGVLSAVALSVAVERH